MSNANNSHHEEQIVYNEVKTEDLPPLSPDDAIFKRNTVCATVRVYLAVWNDLTPGQIRLVSDHVQTCEPCAYQQQLFLGVTRSIHSLPDTEPSPHIDRAVLDAIAASSQTHTGGSMQEGEQFVPPLRSQTRIWPHSLLDLQRRSIKIVALVALFALVIVLSAYFCH